MGRTCPRLGGKCCSGFRTKDDAGSLWLSRSKQISEYGDSLINDSKSIGTFEAE
ncbi:hypothetical protein [Paenibacillus sp. 22594]|uniref:hypothetical protein n=1 Tax=Paenibacillus sp. 22594 TaxID=3453947 RepID=UPI003F83F5CB